MFEERIILDCIEILRALPPIKNVHTINNADVKTNNADAVLDVITDKGSIRFIVEIKGILKRPLPQHFSVMKKNLPHPFLIMADYINPSIAKDLKENEINYIDSQGNAYINIKDYVYVDVQGRKRVTASEKNTTTLFQPTGLQLLFLLLTYPEKLNDPIRTLQKFSSISYGQTQAAMKELKDKKLVVHYNEMNSLKFQDKKSLLEKWLGYYVDRLRPKLVLGSYKIAPSIEKSIIHHLSGFRNKKSSSFAVGGGLGADVLIHYFRGSSIELFITPDSLNEIKSQLKLMPARETNCTLFNLFSPFCIYSENTEVPVAHPLLIYAELLYKEGSRSRETAELIYNEYLRPIIDEA